MSNNDNQRIAKNTLYLYIRMAVMMLVRLYTVRIVLETLGVSDYGLWSAVTALVTAFSFINPTLVTTTQRFLNYDMGNGGKQLVKIFSTGFFFFLIVAVLLTITLESAGLWFLNTKMQIPAGMEQQANFVFQCCILTLIVDMIRMPYESAIISSERMSFYAIVCLLEAFLLLGIVFILPFFDANKLPAYGVLTFIAQGVICITYVIYSHRNFNFARIKKVSDRNLIKNMVSFSGWSIFGSLASMTAVQGLNLLMNVFFGVSANAAFSISLQIYSALWVLAVNVTKAATPRITKDFSAGKLKEMSVLVFNMSKASFFLMLLLAMPMALNIETLLKLWLGNDIPQEAPIFCLLTIAQTAIAAISIIPDSTIIATGKIRNYLIVVSAILCSSIALSYFLFSIGLPAVWALIAKSIVEIAILCMRIYFMHRHAGVSSLLFCYKTLLPIVFVTCSAGGLYYLCNNLIIDLSSINKLCVSTGIWIVIYSIALWCFALSKDNKHSVLCYVKKRLK